MFISRGGRYVAVASLLTFLFAGCGGKTDSPPPSDSQEPAAAAPSTRSSVSDIKALGKPKATTKGSIFDRIGERYALLVGVRNYDKTSGLQPLRYTEKDVTELASVLLEYGYRPENVILMTDSQGAKNPKLLPESRKIQTQLKGLLRDRGKADQVMIAFSGHGLQFKNDKDSYFCPLDAQVEKRSTLVSMGTLYEQLEECPASFKMLLCDACRDDPMIGTSRGMADILGLFRDAPTPPGGVAVFYACSPGEFAREDPDLGHGVFFNFIIEGLRGAADMDDDGKVMLPELEYHAKRRVSDFVRHEFGGQRQMPNLKGDLLGLVALTDKSSLISPAITPPGAANSTNSNPPRREPPPNPILEAMARIEANRPRPDSLPQPTRPQPTPTVTEPAVTAPAITAPPKPAGDPTIDITAGPSATLAASATQNSPLAKMPVMMPQTGEVRRFEDMGWGIDSLAFSPNGRWLAGGKSDRTLLLFDVPEGGNLDFRDDLESLDQVTSLAFSPSGQRLLAAGSAGLIKVFEVKTTGRLVERGQYVGHNDEIHSMHVRSDGKFVLSGGRDGRLHFWQLDTGRLVRAIEGLEEDLQAACFDDATTALATDGEVLLRIDLTNGEIVQRFKLGYSSPHAAAFSPDGSRLVISEMYNLNVWDTRTGRKLGTCEDREIQWTVRFTPQGDRLVSGGGGCVSVWDLSSFFRVQQVQVSDGSGYVQSLAVAPDGQHVAAILSMAGQDLHVFRISQEPSSQLADTPEPPMPEEEETTLASSGTTIDVPKELPSATTRPGRSRLDALPAYNKASGEVRRFDDMGWGVKSMAFSPNGRWLAAGKSDRAVLLLDVIEGGRLDFRDDLESLGQVTCVRFSPNEKYLLAGGYSGRIDIWSISRHGRLKEAARYVGQNEEVKCICIRDDGKYVLSGGEDQKLHFWELATGRIVKIIDGFEDAICAVQFADDTTALVTDGEYLKRIDLKTSEVTRQFKPDCPISQAAAFSPDGQFLVLSDTYDLALFDTRSGRDVKRCETNETPWTAAFTPDGKRLISGGRGRICAWNVKTGFKIHETRMANEIGYVQTLAVAPDGRHVAAITSSAGQDLQVFRLPDR
jgi:WD40 repeat protein